MPEKRERKKKEQTRLVMAKMLSIIDPLVITELRLNNNYGSFSTNFYHYSIVKNQ